MPDKTDGKPALGLALLPRPVGLDNTVVHRWGKILAATIGLPIPRMDPWHDLGMQMDAETIGDVRERLRHSCRRSSARRRAVAKMTERNNMI